MTRNSCQYCRLKKCFAVGMSRGGKLLSVVVFFNHYYCRSEVMTLLLQFRDTDTKTLEVYVYEYF